MSGRGWGASGGSGGNARATTKGMHADTEPSPENRRHPYRELPDVPPFRRPLSWRAIVAFVWVASGSIAMMATSNHQPFDGRGELFLIFGAVTLVGVALAVHALVRLGTFSKEERPYGMTLAAAALPIGLFLAWVGSVMVHTAAYVPSYMGRRHRRGRRLFVPCSEAGSAWTLAAPKAYAIPDADRAALGAEWRDNARKEHASVAAFSQLAVDLMAVGAPPALVAAAHSDALDEIRHAAACFAIARDIDGKTESPAPFAEARVQKRLFTWSRSVALAQIAIDALADGVLNEGIAARLLAQLAKECELPAMRPILRAMAADESRHAAHSWEIVAWCLDEGGDVVASALRGASKGMPSRICCALPEGARSGAWERWGVQGVAMEEEAFAKTRASAATKLETMLVAHRGGPATHGNARRPVSAVREPASPTTRCTTSVPSPCDAPDAGTARNGPALRA